MPRGPNKQKTTRKIISHTSNRERMALPSSTPSCTCPGPAAAGGGGAAGAAGAGEEGDLHGVLLSAAHSESRHRPDTGCCFCLVGCVYWHWDKGIWLLFFRNNFFVETSKNHQTERKKGYSRKSSASIILARIFIEWCYIKTCPKNSKKNIKNENMVILNFSHSWGGS